MDLAIEACIWGSIFPSQKLSAHGWCPRQPVAPLRLGSRVVKPCQFAGVEGREGPVSRLWSSLRRQRDPLVLLWVRVWLPAPEFSSL